MVVAAGVQPRTLSVESHTKTLVETFVNESCEGVVWVTLEVGPPVLQPYW